MHPTLFHAECLPLLQAALPRAWELRRNVSLSALLVVECHRFTAHRLSFSLKFVPPSMLSGGCWSAPKARLLSLSLSFKLAVQAPRQASASFCVRRRDKCVTSVRVAKHEAVPSLPHAGSDTGCQCRDRVPQLVSSVVATFCASEPPSVARRPCRGFLESLDVARSLFVLPVLCNLAGVVSCP